MYENSVKVPGIFNQPGTVAAGRVLEGPYSTYDFMPTLMDYAGLPLPPGSNLPGSGFLGTLRGEAEAERDRVVVFDEFGGTRMIRTREWKYVHRYDVGPNELFDMVNDPDECTSLAEETEQAPRVRAMRNLLEDWFDGLCGAGARREGAGGDGVRPGKQAEAGRRRRTGSGLPSHGRTRGRSRG